MSLNPKQFSLSAFLSYVLTAVFLIVSLFVSPERSLASVEFIPNNLSIDNFKFSPSIYPSKTTTNLLVEWRGGSYFCNERKIPIKLIENLMNRSSEIAFSGQNQPQVKNWLTENATRAASEYARKFERYDVHLSYKYELESSFRSYWNSYSNEDTFGSPSYFPSTLRTQLTIKTNTGRTFRYLSKKPYPQFLSWKVIHPNGDVLEFNNELSIAIAPIIHACSSSSRRSEKNMRQCIIHDLVYNHLFTRILASELLKRFNERVKKAKDSLAITSERILNNCQMHIEHLNKMVKLPSLEATLKSPYLPSNVVFKVNLRLDSAALNRFFSSIREDVNTLSGHDQLLELFRRHPKHTFTIDYFKGDNMNIHETDMFVKDFYQYNKQSRKSVYALCTNAIRIQTEGPESEPKRTRWLLLQDGRMVLWRHNGSQILSWPGKHFGLSSPHITAKIIPWSKFTYASNSWFGF